MIPQVIDLGDGRELVIKIRPKKESLQIQRPDNLEQVWMADSDLSFERFKSELIRIGYLSEHDNKLNLTGKQLRALYKFLAGNHIIKPCEDMKEVYKVFAGSFTLKFNSESSLWRIADLDEDQKFWLKTFAFCVHDSNATQDDDAAE